MEILAAPWFFRVPYWFRTTIDCRKGGWPGLLHHRGMIGVLLLVSGSSKSSTPTSTARWPSATGALHSRHCAARPYAGPRWRVLVDNRPAFSVLSFATSRPLVEKYLRYFGRSGNPLDDLRDQLAEYKESAEIPADYHKTRRLGADIDFIECIARTFRSWK